MDVQATCNEPEDLICYCPECNIPLNLYIIIEGPHKGVKYYNCLHSKMCGVKDLKKCVAESYQRLLNDNREKENVG